MTDRDAFLRAIIEQPNDDRPRLIYADALDLGDGGFPAEPERAEFIRVQCELESIPATYQCCDCLVKDRRVKQLCRWCILLRRERELYGQGGGKLVDVFPVVAGVFLECDYRPTDTHPASGFPGLFLNRGFAERVVIRWEIFSRHAAALLAATPLRKVRLTTAPDDDDCIRYGFKVLARPGQPSLWTADKFPGIEFELPAPAYGFDWSRLANTGLIGEYLRSLGQSALPPG